MINQDEIAKLAREYAEEIYPHEEFEDIGQMDFLRNTAKKNAADFMQFLLRTHCIVEKERVLAEYEAVKHVSEAHRQWNLVIDRDKLTKAELLESLFDAETFKNSEV